MRLLNHREEVCLTGSLPQVFLHDIMRAPRGSDRDGIEQVRLQELKRAFLVGAQSRQPDVVSPIPVFFHHEDLGRGIGTCIRWNSVGVNNASYDFGWLKLYGCVSAQLGAFPRPSSVQEPRKPAHSEQKYPLAYNTPVVSSSSPQGAVRHPSPSWVGTKRI